MCLPFERASAGFVARASSVCALLKIPSSWKRGALAAESRSRGTCGASLVCVRGLQLRVNSLVHRPGANARVPFRGRGIALLVDRHRPCPIDVAPRVDGPRAGRLAPLRRANSPPWPFCHRPGSLARHLHPPASSHHSDSCEAPWEFGHVPTDPKLGSRLSPPSDMAESWLSPPPPSPPIMLLTPWLGPVSES